MYILGTMRHHLELKDKVDIFVSGTDLTLEQFVEKYQESELEKI